MQPSATGNFVADRLAVLGPNGREFKKVFAGAQKQLRATFGMEMVEVPTKDRNLLTAEQKRRGMFRQRRRPIG